MEFYKKNPSINGVIVVRGVSMNDDTVVCGGDFEMFADPMTFPGKPPKLVRVDISELTDEQKEQVAEFISDQRKKPPRHLGVTKSSDFSMNSFGDLKIKSNPSVDRKLEKRLEKEQFIKKETTKDSPMDIVRKQEEPRVKSIADQYSPMELVEALPGVTKRNAKNIIEKVKTMGDLSMLSNVGLRSLGITPPFYKKLRKKARALVEEEKQDG